MEQVLHQNPPVHQVHQLHQIPPVHQVQHTDQVHPSQRRVSCELCRKNKTKCQRSQPDDTKCLRCALNDLVCDFGQQRKVGRPKRKEYVSSSAVDKFRVTKGSKHLNFSDLASLAATVSKDRSGTSTRTHPASSNVYGSFTQVHAEVNSVSHSPAGVRSLVSPAIQRTPDSGWVEFPTFMTDRWYHEKISGAGRGGIVTDAEFGSPPNGIPARPSVPTTTAFPSRDAYDITPAMLDTFSQALFGSSLAWVNPGPPIAAPPPPFYDLTRKKPPLPFGIGRPPTYYVHENKFSSDPSDSVMSSGSLDGRAAVLRLTRILQGLRLRTAMVQANRSLLSLKVMIHREGPFFIESYSLCEYVTNATQDLVQIVAALLDLRQSASKPDEQLSAHVVSTITDIYCLILSFFQLFLEHLTDRAEQNGSNPVIPITGLTFNGMVLTGPCTQGTLFTSSTFYLLGRLDTVLGLDPVSGGTGLLSTNQIDVLYDKLDRSEDLAQRKGIMRPADVRKLFARVAAVLEKLAANE
jgi:hypothetical protein